VNCFNRANICTRTAIGAYVGIYLVDVAFADRINRAFVDAAATSSAIFIDYVSHCYMFLVIKIGKFLCKDTGLLLPGNKKRTAILNLKLI
jgi:hypothetical protein